MENAQETKAFDAPTVAEVLPSAVMPSVPGHDVQEMVGRGGMGKVYRARQTELGRTVAVKLLAHEPDEKSLARFREECRAVARLQHSNIAQLYESGLVEGRPFFTQEFLGGGSLAEKFNGQPQEPKESARIVEIISRAIHFSHQQGILHRDLKPGNILLTADGTPKVTDFGLAKEIVNPNADTPLESSGLTRTGEILGTPSYMAPEQASGVVSKLGPAADVYSLGAILYEALTGRPPFQAPDALQTLFMVLSMEPVSPRVLLPRLPRDIETICLKALEKSPKRRYTSALALAEDLQRFQRGEPIIARPVGKVEQFVKWSKRNKAAAALVVVSVVFFFAILGAATWVIIGNMRLQKANKDLVDAKTDVENKAKDLESANQNLLVAQKESDESFSLAKKSLDDIPNRLALRLFNVPQAEAIMLDAYRSSVEFYGKLTKIRPEDESTAISYAKSLGLLSSNLEVYNKKQESEATAATLDAYLREKAEAFPHSAQLHAIGVHLAQQRKQTAEQGTDEALIARLRKEYVRRTSEYIGKYPNDIETPGFRINRHFTLGSLAGDKNNHAERVKECEQALKVAEEFYKTNPEVPSSFILLLTAISELGMVEEMRNNPLVSRRIYERGLELHEKAAARAKNPKDHSLGIADMKMNIARLHLKTGDPDTALLMLKDVEKIRREQVEAFPLNPWKKYELAESLWLQALATSLEDKTEAAKLYRQAIEIVEKLAKEQPGNVHYTWSLRDWTKALNELKK